jgi:hypothetical protein
MTSGCIRSRLAARFAADGEVMLGEPHDLRLNSDFACRAAIIGGDEPRQSPLAGSKEAEGHPRSVQGASLASVGPAPYGGEISWRRMWLKISF